MIVLDTISPASLNRPGTVKYRVVAEELRARIEAGEVLPGAQLPPVRDLAFQLGVTPGTIARAYSVLTNAGYLTAGVGRGTFVAERRRPVAPDEAARFSPYRHPGEGATVSLLTPRLPDVGQVAVLRDGMVALAGSFSDEAFLRYPSPLTEAAACAAYAAEIAGSPIGPVSATDVVLSSGGQNGILLVMQTVLSGPQPVVLVDDLAYSGFVRAAQLCRAEVVGVPWDDEGPEPDAFAAIVRRHAPQLYCTSAEVSNPLVITTSPGRRAEIARIARQYGVHVLDDDCYRLRAHRGPGYRALLPELGWHLSSPSKSISPALRIGFVVAPDGRSEALRRTAGFAAFAVSRLSTDLYAYVSTHPQMPAIRQRLEDWMARDVAAIAGALGRYRLTSDPQVPYVWLDLPEGWRAGEFCQAAEAAGVLVKSAEDFALRESRRVHGVRLALNGAVAPAQLAGALEALSALLERPPQRISV
jgi:DNA-binding transcriptional MocR family regulator